MNSRKNIQIFKLTGKLHKALDDRDVASAMKCVSRIQQLEKRNVEGALYRARTHGICGDFTEARKWFDAAIEYSPPKQRAHTAMRAADLTLDLYDRSLACDYFRRSLSFSPSTRASLGLANSLMKYRNQDDAKAIIDELRATKDAPQMADLIWVKIHKYHAGADIVLSKLCDSTDPEISVQAKYELGRLLDHQGEYKKAYQYFTAAKQMLVVAGSRKQQARRNSRIKMHQTVDSLSKEDLKSWKKAVSLNEFSEKGLALLAGHPRSGTTLVEQILDSHSGVVSVEEAEIFQLAALMPAMKVKFEVQNPADIFRGLSDRVVQSSRKDYFEWMARHAEKELTSRLLIDKNPSLTSMIPALKRFLPEMKMVMMIRDPRDVVMSCFMQTFLPLNEVTSSFLSLEEATEEYSAVMGVYYKLMDMISEDVCEVVYEDLVVDPSPNIQRLFSFLGLEWDPGVMNFHERASKKVVRSPTADAVTEKLHTRAKGRWHNYAEYLEPCQKSLEPFLKKWGYA